MSASTLPVPAHRPSRPAIPGLVIAALVWIAAAVAGLVSLAVVATSRGEAVNANWLVVAAFCAAAISYRFYSSWLCARVLALDDSRATPACVLEDGKDFVRTNRDVYRFCSFHRNQCATESQPSYAHF